MKRFILISFAALAMAAFATPAAARDSGSAQTAVQSKDNVKTVVLAASGENKIQVIKIVREYLGIGLKEAHELVSSTPSVIKKDVPVKEAEDLARKLEEVGAKVELK